jgi:hypothetical protein
MAVSTNETMALSIKKLMVYLGQAWMVFLHTIEQLLHELFSFLLTCDFHSTGTDSLFVETASLHSSLRQILYLRVMMLRKNN